MTRKLLTAFILPLMSSVFMATSAYADTGYAYLACEAGTDAPTKYVLGPVFEFEYEYTASPGIVTSESDPSFADMTADEMAENLWNSLNESEDREKQFKPQVDAAHLKTFLDNVKAQLGVSCLSKHFTNGPMETLEDTDLQRNVTDAAWIDFRLEADNVTLERVEIEYSH